MLEDLKGAYQQALKQVEDNSLHVIHVGLYENRTVIVLHKDKNAKEVKVIDCTDNPEETETGLSKKTSPPETKTPSIKKSKLACDHCGKVLKNLSGKIRHEKKCAQQ